MTPHIIVQGSSLKYAELPPKRSIHNPDKPTKEYQKAIESAIDVHPESVEFVINEIVKFGNLNRKRIYDGSLRNGVYPIEAKVRIVETCKWNGDKNSCGNETCWDLGECQKSPSKQYAILEPKTKDEIDKEFIDMVFPEKPENSGTEGSEHKLKSCYACGGKMVEIRGRYPNDPPRVICPTCTYERLEQIHEISSEHYGKAYSS